MSIYQTEEWKKVMISAGYAVVELKEMNAFESTIFTPFGKKKIIFARGSPSKEALLEFIQESKRYFYGTITPKITNYEDSFFKELGFKRRDYYTPMIDLTKTKEEIWGQLEKKSVRWGVKTAEKNNLKFLEIKPGELEEVYKLYSDTVKKGGINPEPLEFIKAVQNDLVPAGLAKIFVVKKDGQILVCAVLLIDDDHNMINITGANEEGYRLQAMPFLYWNLILFSKEIKKHYIDLGGYDKEAKKGEKSYNINKFKENFGGEIWAQPVYATNSKYVVFRNLIKRFRFIKSLYKKAK